MRRLQRAREEVTQTELLNLTPLIDVVFVVLIMFILVAPLVEMEHISLAPPSTITKEEMQPLGTKVVVSRDGAITVDGVSVPLSGLQPLLCKKQKEKLSLYHDEEAPFGMYQNIKSAAEQAGFTELDLIVQAR